MQTVKMINFILMCLFFACYMYQFLYIPVSWLPRKRRAREAPLHRFAVLIAACNEETVIGNLLDSIKAQSYPERFLEVFVVADNCRDKTAETARAHGAEVYERHNASLRGKGYALDFLLREMERHAHNEFDGYIVLDADNVLERDFVSRMNETFSEGKDIVTCYRDSKNYGDNWISAGYGLWFLRESRYLNGARSRIGASCGVSGTGFLFSRAVLEGQGGGWPFHLLTEDIEFTIENVTAGRRVGYCPEAVLYDEQPVRFKQSWAQRLRWSRGYLQVFRKYGGKLLSGMFRGSFSCYDMAMNIMPAAVLTASSVVVNLSAAVVNFYVGGDLGALTLSVFQTLLNLYLTLFILGSITTITEWKQIHCSTGKKLLYALTFPIFMFTYVPITIASLFGDVQWKPIKHERSMSLGEITGVCGKKVS